MYFLVCILMDVNTVLAKLVIKEWHQDNVFTEKGQEVQIKLKLKVEGLKDNYYHNNWGYVFDKQAKVKILEAKLGQNKKNNTKFENNKLVFNFDNLFNDQELFVEFKYLLENQDLSKNIYVRREYVYIPNFAEKAVASITVQPLKTMEVYTLNDVFVKEQDGKYYWVGNVPKDGFMDHFDMTKKHARWMVTTNIDLVDNNNIGNISIKGPAYYKGGGNKILLYGLSNNQFTKVDNNNLKHDDDFVYFKFNDFNSVNGFAQIKAIVENTYSDFLWAKEFDPNKSMTIDPETMFLLTNISEQIKEEYPGEQALHIKIAKWVNKNIKYNSTMTGKNLTSQEILEQREGVCIHYALLYRDILRSINIPAVAVSGLGYNFDKQIFEGHAWTMVNYNGQWFPIDPTWGIYSGKLPISHIFMYKNTDTSFEFNKEGTLDQFSATITSDAKFLRIQTDNNSDTKTEKVETVKENVDEKQVEIKKDVIENKDVKILEQVEIKKDVMENKIIENTEVEKTIDIKEEVENTEIQNDLANSIQFVD